MGGPDTIPLDERSCACAGALVSEGRSKIKVAVSELMVTVASVKPTWLNILVIPGSSLIALSYRLQKIGSVRQSVCVRYPDVPTLSFWFRIHLCCVVWQCQVVTTFGNAIPALLWGVPLLQNCPVTCTSLMDSRAKCTLCTCFADFDVL